MKKEKYPKGMTAAMKKKHEKKESPKMKMKEKRMGKS